jgi:hypothetical protein
MQTLTLQAGHLLQARSLASSNSWLSSRDLSSAGSAWKTSQVMSLCQIVLHWMQRSFRHDEQVARVTDLSSGLKSCAEHRTRGQYVCSLREVSVRLQQ